MLRLHVPELGPYMGFIRELLRLCFWCAMPIAHFLMRQKSIEIPKPAA